MVSMRSSASEHQQMQQQEPRPLPPPPSQPSERAETEEKAEEEGPSVRPKEQNESKQNRALAKTRTNKDLLRLEHREAFPPGAKWLSICKAKKEQNVIPSSVKTMPLQSLTCENSVLSRVRAFLPVLDEANRKLAEAIKEKGPEYYDIEVLKRHEDVSYVEMDLALGVADLHSNDAVSAAERLAGGQVVDTQVLRNEEGSEDESGNLSSEGEVDAMDLLKRRRKLPRIEPLS